MADTSVRLKPTIHIYTRYPRLGTSTILRNQIRIIATLYKVACAIFYAFTSALEMVTFKVPIYPWIFKAVDKRFVSRILVETTLIVEIVSYI